MISLVVAMDEHGLIGNKGSMPWHCPADLQHFKALTLHHDIVMGRTTYVGLPKTLHERNIYVVTRNPDYNHATIHVCHDLKSLLLDYLHKKEILYVCGGADVYAQASAYADEFWVSYIHGTFCGDTWFPPCAVTALSTCFVKSKQDYEGFTLVHYVRINKEG